MILVTGGTGFVGQALVRHLVANGHSVRILLRPSKRSPRLPSGIPVEVAVCSLGDQRGLRAALHNIDIVFHLASSEGQGGRADLKATDADGTGNLTQAAAEIGIQRLFYLSHLGADRASGFPVLKAKGIAEDHIRHSGVAYTILRSAILFGPNDNFTTDLAKLITAAPGLLPLPAQGKALLQPLWVEDLATCLIWSLDNPETVNKTYEVGGSEYFSLRQIAKTIMNTIRTQRLIISMPMPYMRALTVLLEYIFPQFPTSPFWLDYMSVNRTCAVDSVPRFFGLMPARFAMRLDHLRGISWPKELLRTLFSRHA